MKLVDTILSKNRRQQKIEMKDYTVYNTILAAMMTLLS